jgi:lysozyme
MKISNKGLQFIKAEEGYRSKVYICAAGYPTIGYGHVCTPFEIEKYKGGLLPEEGGKLLERDLNRFEKSVNRLTAVPLTQNQYDALVSFTFNVGTGALQRSTLRMKLNRAEYDAAAEEFPKWCRGGGRILKGLLRRRLREQRVFLS